MDQSISIDRGFIRIPSGLVHYRTASPLTPVSSLALYMAHAGPLSSRSLVDLIGTLGERWRVLAPDMLGNGDSDPPLLDRTDMGFYVDCVVETLDRLGIEQVDFYGQHTGAHIGCELAIRHPERVRSLIMDGVGLFPETLMQQMKTHYAQPRAPDEFGGHLAWAWHWVRDLFLHFPHFLRDPEHRLHKSTVPGAEVLHLMALDLLKALPTYHLAYQAVFDHPVAERLPLLRLPTLVMSVDSDPLATYLDAAAALVPGAVRKRVGREARATTIAAFLSGL